MAYIPQEKYNLLSGKEKSALRAQRLGFLGVSHGGGSHNLITSTFGVGDKRYMPLINRPNYTTIPKKRKVTAISKEPQKNYGKTAPFKRMESGIIKNLLNLPKKG